MAKQRLVSDILMEVSKETSRKKKIQILKSHNKNQALVTMLKLAFDESLVWELPEGEPPFKKNELFQEENTSGLYQELRKMKYFIKGRNNLKPIKREQLFIEILEMVHPDEAQLILWCKDGKLPYNGVTEKLVKEAFPGLIK